MKLHMPPRVSRPRPALRAASAPRAAAWLAALLAAILVAAPAARLAADPRIEDHESQADFFTIGVDPRVAQLNANAERFHLGEDTFWGAYRAGRYETALNELRFILRYLPNHPRALYLMGEVCRASGDLFYPIRYFERALTLYPHRAYTRAQYGAYFMSIGETAAAVRELRQAVAADSTLLVARAWLRDAEAKARSAPPHAP
jgi:tetratricopeptide (TPR) repeat protein